MVKSKTATIKYLGTSIIEQNSDNCAQSDMQLAITYKHIQSNFGASNSDGSNTMDGSN